MTESGGSSDEQQQSLPAVPEAELPGALVALLFAVDRPVQVAALARTAGYEVQDVRAALDALRDDLQRLGLFIQTDTGDRVQLSTNPSYAGLIRRFLGIERSTKLSPAALEVLAVIGYRQPVTRPEIDAVRGVDSSGVIQTLLARELIEPVGRLAGPGNPIQFGTTGEFLRLFGLESLDELPEIPDELISPGGVPETDGVPVSESSADAQG